MRHTKSIIDRCVIGLLVASFTAAGTAKLMGLEQLHQSFTMMGLPSWFGYFIGLMEVAGAIGLLILKLRVTASVGLVIIMLGASYFHLAYQPLETVIPALILGSLCIYTIVMHRKIV